ncbi:MAG: SusC/RagA family TonB-linked outer membrane protein [Chitinophagaceae bacterium]|nr:SusC/RagA family TonB-linked outer membrane protein [Chitinophagaceae bacterium]
MRKIIPLLVMIPLLFYFGSAQAQERTINGTVSSERNSEPVISATITNLRTKKSVQTSANGAFSIRAQKGDELQLSSVGFIEKKITVGDQSQLTLTLAVSAGQLAEVIVTTAFGIKKTKRSQGTASQSVTGQEINDTQRDNWMNAISGRVAGATVNTTSGAPGASSQIVLRGFNSIGGDNSALIILDGIPLNNSVFSQHRLASDIDNRNNDYTNRAADINPDDIESINVLKGPEAAALYGTEAGNGAIIITTKKGKAGKLKVSYDNSFRFEQITRFHEVQKVYDNGTNGLFQNTTRLFFGPKYAEGTKFYDNPKNFFNVGTANKHNVSLEGGRGFTSFRGSGSYYDQEGTIPYTGNKKINARISLYSKVTKKLEITGSLAYYYQFNRKAFRGTDGYYLSLLRWPLEDDARRWRNINGNRRIISKTAGLDNPAEANNPFFETERNKNFDRTHRVTANFGATYEAADWLTFDWKVGADAYGQYGAYMWDKEAFNAYTFGGRIEEYNSRFKGFTSIFLASARKKIGNWGFTLRAGNAFDDRTTTDWSVRGDSLNVSADYIDFKNMSTAFTSPLKRLNSRTQGRDTLTLQRSIGLFADLNISLKDFLYINIAGRNDWLAEFPPHRRSYFYPSANVAFIFSEFIPKNKVLTYGKLRASIARTGKRVAPYSNQSVYTNAVASTNGYGYAYGFGANNPDLFPEQQTAYEVGTELSFFNNVVTLDLTAYQIDIANSVATNARPSYATGFILYTSNIADLTNKGFEAVANFNLIRNSTVNWSVRANFSKTTNKVTRLPLPEFYNSDSWIAGYRASLYRGLPTTTIGGQDYQRTAAGEILIDAATGLPAINANYVSIGDRNPDFVMGFTNTFSYKNIRFSFTLDWKQGGDVLNGTELFLTQQGLSKRTLNRENTIIVPGVLNDGLQESANPTRNTIPITPYYQQDYYTGRSLAVDFVEHDVNWLRLRDVTLSYSFDANLIRRSRVFSAARLFVTGTDLFMITNYSGPDPSSNGNTPATGGVGGFAIDLGSTPTPIGINFGLGVTFKNGK